MDARLKSAGMTLFLFITLPLVTALSQTGRITVASTPSSAEVYVDSLLAGTTPLEQHLIPVGIHHLKVVYPNATSWLNISKIETIDVAADSDVRYTFELGSLLTLNSNPSGAIVKLRDRELGVTPLYYRSPSPLSGTLLVTKDGYEPGNVSITPETVFPPLITLSPTVTNGTKLPDVLPPDHENGSDLRWETYAAAASMVIAGVLSAYWKDQANQDFDKYVQTRDPALLASTQRLDHRAGIAITLSHASFAALAYLLLSE
ncbi:MAG: PEGA domain-containing protein [Ignavibacteriae bacterium]|nr:PEGA domain-containing protein [Ignavibacteriota bacterium]